MALSAKLQLRQSQSLVMTPQLMQSIKLLQLTHVELDRFIDEEIERNPLLERAEAYEDEPSPSPETPAEADLGAPEGVWGSEAASEILDATLENVFPDDIAAPTLVGPDLAALWKSAGTGAQVADIDSFDLEDVASARPTLQDAVGEQIVFAGFDSIRRLVAHELADGLDEAGYFRGDVDEIAARLGVHRRDVADVLTACQQFDPPGLFARTLAECLGLQLARRNRFDPAMKALLNHLDLLARRDFHALRRLCGVDEADLMDMVAEIRALDPRPGQIHAGGSADTIVPDVEVRLAADGTWLVELNNATLPRVLVDQGYYAQVHRKARNQAEREFVADCLQSANWLTRSLDQRAKTILKVSTEIVRQQDGFLMNGIRHLRPLNLRTVAEAVGMHESTVSRVTSNKYMLTPRGVFELRFFFTASIASASGGEAHSSEAVRDRIRRMIEAEQSVQILSDDAIVDILRGDGIDIARRTVAKYREGMNIPSSVQRRREKRALAEAGH